jgi:hypothetical protein
VEGLRCAEVRWKRVSFWVFIYVLHINVNLQLFPVTHTTLRNDCELSSGSSELVLPLIRLRRLFGQAETFWSTKIAHNE